MLNKVSILYEDADLLVINKPAGLAVHSDGRTKEDTVADWVLSRYPNTQNVGEPVTVASGAIINRPGIVHRLDRETSGALLIAKTQEAFLWLKKQFQSRTVHKEYHSFVYGLLPNDFGTINLPIGRSKTDFRKWSAESGARGELREAVTYYEVMGRGKEATFLRALPKTGRTHQIRVHFKALHHPIVSDALYAPKKAQILGFERTALHAFSLEFEDLSGKTLSINAPYPEDFSHAIEVYQKEPVA